MDLLQGVEKRFAVASSHRISHGPKSKSKVRRGEKQSYIDGLLKRLRDTRKNTQDAVKKVEKPNV